MKTNIFFPLAFIASIAYNQKFDFLKGKISREGQSSIRDTISPSVIFFDDFNDNANKWTIGENKNERVSMVEGVYSLTALRSAYGEAHEIKIDTKKDFEIESRIKITAGNSEHKNYYSMLFWGREGTNGYYFTFAKDGYVSVKICDGLKQHDCVTKPGSLQKTDLNPDDFNIYTIRKTAGTYSFLVNGKQIYQMPFASFFGNLIGFGAGRKVSLAVDYLKVSYL